MVFSSITFLFLYLPVIMVLYLICPVKLRNFLLLLGSCFFYFWGEKWYVLILLFSTVFDYANSWMIGKFKAKKPKLATLFLVISVVGNLAILCLFKYSDFFITNMNNLGLNWKTLGLSLPIGISFYTFQTMSYTIDVYRGKVDVQKNIISFGTYVTMFPQLIAGPIVRYSEVEKEINKRSVTVIDFAEGIGLFVVGLGKKVLLANAAGSVWELVLAADDRTVVMAWLGAIMFAFQIYFDFSGYSDMAIGLGRMFGFHFPRNFNYPYIADSIKDFWRRWHITLSTWFREYVYIPLGGSHCSKLKTVRNLFIVWALTGFWHGASWNYLLWGLYFFVLLTLERFVYGEQLAKAPAVVRHIYAMVLVLFGWVLFAIENLGEVGVYFTNLFYGQFCSQETIYLLFTNLLLLVFLVLGSTEMPKKVSGRLMMVCSNNTLASTLLRNGFYLCIMILSVCCLLRDSYNPFLYFKF